MALMPFNFGPVYNDIKARASTFSGPVVSVKNAAQTTLEAQHNGLSLAHRGLQALSFDENKNLLRNAIAVDTAAATDPVPLNIIDAMAQDVADKILTALNDLSASNAVPLDELVALLYQSEMTYVTASMLELRYRRAARLVKLQNTERTMMDEAAATGARGLPGRLVQKLAEMYSEAEVDDAQDMLSLQKEYVAGENEALLRVLDALSNGSVSAAAVGIFRLGVQAYVVQREVSLSLREAQYRYAGALLRQQTEVDTFADKIDSMVLGEIRRRMSLDAQRKKLVDLTEFTAKPKIEEQRAKVESAQRLLSLVNNMVQLQITTGLRQAFNLTPAV